MQHIIIEGFMGTGKSQVARGVAERLAIPFVDVDELVAEKMNLTVQDIYERFGEAYYRAEESLVISELSKLKKRSVVLLGSGALLLPKNEAYLKEAGTVYYLKAPADILAERIAASEKHVWVRSGNVEDKVKKMLKAREPGYSRAADVIFESADMTIEELIEAVVDAEYMQEDILLGRVALGSDETEKGTAKKASGKKASAKKAKDAEGADEAAAAEKAEKKPAKKAAAKKAKKAKEEDSAAGDAVEAKAAEEPAAEEAEKKAAKKASKKADKAEEAEGGEAEGSSAKKPAKKASKKADKAEEAEGGEAEGSSAKKPAKKAPKKVEKAAGEDAADKDASEEEAEVPKKKAAKKASKKTDAKKEEEQPDALEPQDDGSDDDDGEYEIPTWSWINH